MNQINMHEQTVLSAFKESIDEGINNLQTNRQGRRLFLQSGIASAIGSVGLLHTSPAFAVSDGGIPIWNPLAPADQQLIMITEANQLATANAIVAVFKSLYPAFVAFHNKLWPAGNLAKWMAPMQVRFTAAFVTKIYVDHKTKIITADGKFIYLQKLLGYVFTYGLGAWFSVVIEQFMRRTAEITLKSKGVSSLNLLPHTIERISYFVGGLASSTVLVTLGLYFVDAMIKAIAEAEKAPGKDELRKLQSTSVTSFLGSTAASKTDIPTDSQFDTNGLGPFLNRCKAGFFCRNWNGDHIKVSGFFTFRSSFGGFESTAHMSQELVYWQNFTKGVGFTIKLGDAIKTGH